MHEGTLLSMGTQLPYSMIFVTALQILKKSSWFPWLNAETQKLNKIVGIALAGATALGIHMHFDPQAHVLTISDLSWAGIIHSGADWLRAYFVQQGWFKLSTKP